MNYNVEIYDKVDEDWWNTKLLENNASTLYQSFNWIKLYQENLGSKPFFILVRNSKDEIVGQLAAIIHYNALRNENIFAKKIGSKINLSSVLTWFYGPILYAESNQNEILAEILSTIDRLAMENKISLIRGASPPLEKQFSNLPFQNHNYDIKPWATYIIDLGKKIDDIYNKLDKKTRYDIRKSESEELEFEVAEGKSYFKEFSELKNEEYERTGRKKSKITNSNNTEFEYLYKKGYQKVFLARHKGKPISGISNIIFNGNIVQHGVANSKSSILGGTFVTWNAIKWAIENNYRTYDVGGVNPFPDSEKERNIEFFKSKWGGKKYEYLLFTKIMSKTKVKLSSILKDPKKIIYKIPFV